MNRVREYDKILIYRIPVKGHRLSAQAGNDVVKSLT